MDPMTTAVIETPFGQKTIDVVCADIRELDEPLEARLEGFADSLAAEWQQSS